MWFIFIAVLIVVAVMLVFLLMAIRLLASQAKQSLDGYFMKNLEVYEELEENLSLRTRELQGQIDGQEKKLDILQKKQARMEEMTSAVRSRKETAGGDGILSMVQAVYRDGDFMEDYSYIRSRMRFSTESIMKNVQGRINFQEDEKTEVCQGILDKFPEDTLYQMITLPAESQKEVLETVLSPMEEAVLEEYLSETDRTEPDMLEFMEYLHTYVRSHGNMIHVRSARPGAVKIVPDANVQVEEDPSIHEGLKIIYKNQLYDYSI